MTPSGTLIANSHCHEATDRIPAATLGPIAAEVEPTTRQRQAPTILRLS